MGLSESYGDPVGGHEVFGLCDGVLAEMEDACGQDRVGLGQEDRIDHVLWVACPAAGDHWDRDGLGDRLGNGQIVAVFGSIAIHARYDDFACAEFFDSLGPFDDFDARGGTPAVDKDFPKLFAIFDDPAGIHVHDDALGSESFGGLADEVWVFASDRIEGYFIASGLQQIADIVDGPNPASDRQRHEDLVGRASDHIDHDRALLVACGDIEEDQFVGSFEFVASGDFDRVPCIAELDKVGPFDDATGMDIQTGNNAFGEHH